MLPAASVTPRWLFDDAEVPHLVTPLPGPRTRGFSIVAPSLTPRRPPPSSASSARGP